MLVTTAWIPFPRARYSLALAGDDNYDKHPAARLIVKVKDYVFTAYGKR